MKENENKEGPRAEKTLLMHLFCVSLRVSYPVPSIIAMNRFLLAEVAKLPIIVACFRNGFTLSTLKIGSVLSLMEKILGFNSSILQKELSIVPNTMLAVSTYSFQQLSLVISHPIQTPMPVKYLYVLSFEDLLSTVLTNKSSVNTVKAIDSSIRYMALVLSLSDTRLMYDIPMERMLTLSLVGLSHEYANVTGREIAVSLNLTIAQEKLLANVRIKDAQILFGYKLEVLDFTSERLGHKIIHAGNKVVNLFTPMDELLAKHSKPLSSLMQMYVQCFLNMGQLSAATLKPILQRLNVTIETFEFVYSRQFDAFAQAFSLNLPSFSKLHFFAVLRRFSGIVQGKNVYKEHNFISL